MSEAAEPPMAKSAVIFAATGEIASATAFELGRRGTRLYLSGRNEQHLKALETAAREHGLSARVDCVNACDESDVRRYFAGLANQGIAPDIVFNGIGVTAAEGDYGTTSADLSLAAFLLPLQRIVGSQFITAAVAAREMAHLGKGTIVLLTSSLAKVAIPKMAGITAASDAIEGLARVLGAELAASRVRVLCARVAGIPESRTIRETMAANARSLGIPVEAYAERLPRGEAPPLTIQAVANCLAHLALDDAAAPLSPEPINIGQI